MAFANPSYPNLPDFIVFCQNQGVYATFLPVDSDYYQWALTYGEDRILCNPCINSIEYVLAVYNLSLHRLISIAPDRIGLGIDSMAWSGGYVTVVTDDAMTIPNGTVVDFTVSGTLPAGYNGQFTDAQIVSSISFLYPLPTNPGAVITPGTFGTNFFADLREQFNLMQLTPGVVQSAYDQGTGDSLVVPDFFKGLQYSNLDWQKTPWGRYAMAYLQAYGPTIVAFS